MSASQKLSMILTASLVIVMAIFYATLLVPKSSDQNAKLLGVVILFSIIAAIVAGFISLYYFSANPAYQIQFVLILVMIMLPVALTAMATATVQLSGLRNTLAAGEQKVEIATA